MNKQNNSNHEYRYAVSSPVYILLVRFVVLLVWYELARILSRYKRKLASQSRATNAQFNVYDLDRTPQPRN